MQKKIFLNLLDGTKQFNVSDNIGSVRASIYVNGDSTRIVGYDYKPFGDTLNCETESRIGFGGSERDKESRYFDMGVRQYDPATGRFLSIDPFFAKFPFYNPYHYSYNNPVSFKDPTGFAPEKELKGNKNKLLVMQTDPLLNSNMLNWAITNEINSMSCVLNVWHNLSFCGYNGDNVYGGPIDFCFADGSSQMGTSQNVSAPPGGQTNEPAIQGSTIVDFKGKVVKTINDGDNKVYQLKKGEEYNPNTFDKSTHEVVGETTSDEQYKEGDQFEHNEAGFTFRINNLSGIGITLDFIDLSYAIKLKNTDKIIFASTKILLDFASFGAGLYFPPVILITQPLYNLVQIMEWSKNNPYSEPNGYIHDFFIPDKTNVKKKR